VPDVAGKTEQEATTALTAAGLSVNPTRQPEDSPERPQGQVTKTDPPVGTVVEEGAQVTLYVSTGNVAVPDVVGKTKQEALDLLNAQKLTGNTSEVQSTQPAGTVVTQDQAPGTPVKQGRTINLTIAVAPTTTTVPTGLVGMTYDQAVEALKAAGLENVNRIDDVSDTPKDQVLRTEPTAGTEVPFDQQIDIHVSKGPPAAGDNPGGNGGKNP